MMVLVVDIGNSNTVFGLYGNSGGGLLKTWRVCTNRESTRDELLVMQHAFLQYHQIHPEQIAAVVICSVVPPITTELAATLSRLIQSPVHLIDSGLDLGIPLRIENPYELGGDRLVNAYAGLHRYGAPFIIVDLGTATTFDVVSDRGEFLGGVIAPGLQISLDALSQRAARLAPVDLSIPDSAIGKHTSHAMQSGAVLGHAGMIDSIVDRLSAELCAASQKRAKCKIIATGGLARKMQAASQRINMVEDNLTLDGLFLIYKHIIENKSV